MAELGTSGLDELAAIVGVSRSSLVGYAREPEFPANVSTSRAKAYRVRDVVLWWLRKKAKRPLKREVFRSLAAELGVDEPQSPRSRKEEISTLREAAKLETELRQFVRVSDVQDILSELASGLSGALGQVEVLTGRPVANTVQEPFERCEEQLLRLQRGRQRI